MGGDGFDARERDVELAVKPRKRHVGDGCGRDEMHVIVVDPAEQFGVDLEHAVQVEGPVPGFRTQIHRDGEQRQKAVGLVESREELSRIPVSPSSRWAWERHLAVVAQHVVKHAADRHRVMDMRWVLDPEDHADHPAVLPDDRFLQSIPILLRGLNLH